MEPKKNLLPKSSSNRCFGCSAKLSGYGSGLFASQAKGPKAVPGKDKAIAHQKGGQVDPQSPKPACLCTQPPQPTTPSQPDKESVILRSIVADNSKYFIDKSKVCCSVKPSDLKLQLPSTTGHTMYTHDFTKKHCSDASVKLGQVQPYRAKYPFMDLTNYKVNYVEHPIGPGKQLDRDIPKDEEAPRFLQTMYKGDFKNWGGRSTNLKIQPQENNVFGGGVFNSKTMYRSEFGLKSPSACGTTSCAPTGTKYLFELHSQLFLDMNMPVTSNYRNEFTHKSASMQKNCKPKNIYVPSVGNQATFNTEYKKMFDPKEHNGCHYRKVMSVKELQDLISKK